MDKKYSLQDKQLLMEDPMEFKRRMIEAEKAVIQLARKDPAVFCQYVLRDERSGKPIKLSKLHKEFHKIATEQNRSVLWSHPESGKCEISGTKVLLSDGTWADIESLNREVEILAFDPRSLKFKKCKAGPVENNGVRAVLKFVTDTGEVVSVTYEHPLATQRGWIKASEIVPGDKLLNVVKAPTNYVSGYGDYSVEEAHSLGWLLHSPTPHFSSVGSEKIHWTQKFYTPRKMFINGSQKDKRLFHPEVALLGKLVSKRMMQYKSKKPTKTGTMLNWVISDREIQQLYVRHMLTKNTIRNGVKVFEFQEHVYRAPMDWQVQLLRAFFAGASANPKRKANETIHKGQFYPSGLPSRINSYNYNVLRGIKLLMIRLGFPCIMKAHTKDCQLDISGNT
jgi:hypothetical protein